ncbi:MAG: cation diffusion facilitator family transporter [Paracoccaceae bacterium]
MRSVKNASRLNAWAGAASVAVAIFLVGLKLWALAATGALSVAASLTDSALDLLMSLTNLVAILYATKPADEDHAFGHTSVEDLAALAQAAFVAVSALTIGVAATGRLISQDPPPLARETGGIAVMAISMAVTLVLVLWQRHVAARTGSRVVAADSLHYLTDLLPNAGAMLALAASALFAMGRIDSIVAIAASVMLLAGAFRIGRGAFDALMDRRAPPEVVHRVAAMTRDWPGVLGFHDLKTRTAGSKTFIQIHIELDGSQPLAEAHAIGAGLRHAILEAFPSAEVIIHQDPFRRDEPASD